MRKYFLFILLALSVSTLVACEGDDNYVNDGGRKMDDVVDDNIDDEENTNDEEENNDQLLELTLTELAMYDGKNGNDAYIAVDGKIYDVTEAWTNGTHNGVDAGEDVTTQILSAPHGESVLENLEQVGILIDE